MKNQSVVVMSANDVAAMRNAHKEAEAAYFEAKVGALRFATNEMEKTNEEYTLHQLTAMTGLSPHGSCSSAEWRLSCRFRSRCL